METVSFALIVEMQLIIKEYATDDDRLHNFKNAAGMMSCDPKEALAGMMAKHTISVYDMCRSCKDYPIELWNEKITDHINYLLLLKAIVEEDHWHETLGNEGEKIVKKLKRMAENSIYGLIMTKDSEDINDDLAVIIVAPYKHLVEQWVEDIVKFNMKPIIAYGDPAHKDWRKKYGKHKVVGE